MVEKCWQFLIVLGGNWTRPRTIDWNGWSRRSINVRQPQKLLVFKMFAIRMTNYEEKNHKRQLNERKEKFINLNQTAFIAHPRLSNCNFWMKRFSTHRNIKNFKSRIIRILMEPLLLPVHHLVALKCQNDGRNLSQTMEPNHFNVKRDVVDKMIGFSFDFCNWLW